MIVFNKEQMYIASQVKEMTTVSTSLAVLRVEVVG